jgi:hypothetical protein
MRFEQGVQYICFKRTTIISTEIRETIFLVHKQSLCTVLYYSTTVSTGRLLQYVSSSSIYCSKPIRMIGRTVSPSFIEICVCFECDVLRPPVTQASNFPAKNCKTSFIFKIRGVVY